MPSPRLTTLPAAATGSSSWYRQRSGGLAAIVAGSVQAATRSRSYLASSGEPHEHVPWICPAWWGVPHLAHSRCVRAEYAVAVMAPILRSGSARAA